MDNKILIVDDEINDIEILAEALADITEVYTTDSGKNAIAIIENALHIKSPFNMVLIDIHMPEMTGIELIYKIRELEKTVGVENNIKIIVVTAYCRPYMNALKVGADRYMFKPIQISKLRKEIQCLFKQ